MTESNDPRVAAKMYNRSQQQQSNYAQVPSSPPISGRTRARKQQQQQGQISNEVDELPENNYNNDDDDSFQDPTYTSKRKHKRTSNMAHLDDGDEDNDNELEYSTSKRRDRSSTSVVKDKRYNSAVPGRSSYTREHELEQQVIISLLISSLYYLSTEFMTCCFL